jgi:hypothetical protein
MTSTWLPAAPIAPPDPLSVALRHLLATMPTPETNR